ncbi:MAG: TIGR01212 family radical SAM protein [Bacteroidetes bacterium RBG_13_42_15]|nr:MAG: TIGR01212 family radical SAM protein [Bacteroidetes bacterium RBG_13_42_15]
MDPIRNIANNYTWGHKRRFNAFPDYFRKVYGSRMQKVCVDAGFTCPNRDGSKGTGGCTYCNNKAFNPSYCLVEKTVTRQIDEGIEFHKKRYRKAESYLVYFQAYSNTYAPLDTLSGLFSEALDHRDVKGLVIGTRPDCVNNEILDFLKELSEKYILLIEYGIESCYDKTLLRINRGHSFREAVDALEATALRSLDQGAHFIFGLPGETREEMLKEAEIISELPLRSVKFHQLQIIKGTKMEEEYQKNPSDFEIFTWDDYLDFIIKFLERLNPAIVVERFTGEAPPRFLTREIWGKKRTDQIVALIEKRLEELNTWQGRLYRKKEFNSDPLIGGVRGG